MDLTTAATAAADQAQAAQEAANRLRKEKALINDRTRLKEGFASLLGIEVAEADLVRCDVAFEGRHCVIVDGVGLGLRFEKGESWGRHPHDHLAAVYVDPETGEASPMDTSLSCHSITTLADLGRIIHPDRRHSVTFYSPAPDRDTGFHTRKYAPGVGLLEYGA